MSTISSISLLCPCVFVKRLEQKGIVYFWLTWLSESPYNMDMPNHQRRQVGGDIKDFLKYVKIFLSVLVAISLMFCLAIIFSDWGCPNPIASPNNIKLFPLAGVTFIVSALILLAIYIVNLISK